MTASLQKRLGAGLLAALLTAGISAPSLAADASEDTQSGAEGGGMSVEEAWSNAREDWRALQEASDGALDAAREEFEKSWSRLQGLMSEQDGSAPPPDNPEALGPEDLGEDAQE